MQPFELSLIEASRAVRARELSPVELTESHRRRRRGPGRSGPRRTGDLRKRIAWAAARDPHGAQGSDRRRGDTHHGELARPGGACGGTRQPGGRTARRRRGRPPGQDAHARVRLRPDHSADDQRLGPQPGCGWVERRLGGSCRRRRGDVRHGHGHGRFHPGPRGPERRGGPQADVRPGPTHRRDLAVLVPGPCGPSHPHRPGRRAGAVGDRRPRPAGPGERVRPHAGPLPGRRPARTEGRRTAEPLLRPGHVRGRGVRTRRDRAAGGAGGGARRCRDPDGALHPRPFTGG